jgi:hypothetical protein
MNMSAFTTLIQHSNPTRICDTSTILTVVFLDDFVEIWSHSLLHHSTTMQQRDYIKMIKGEPNVEKDVAVVQMDFAENYNVISQNEIRSSNDFYHTYENGIWPAKSHY